MINEIKLILSRAMGHMIVLCLLPISVFTQQSMNVIPLSETIFIHQTNHQLSDSGLDEVLMNGLLINSSDGVILVNTPPSELETSKLTQWIETVLKKPIILFVATDLSPFSIAGIKEIKALGPIMATTKDVLSDSEYSLPGDISFVPFEPGYYTIGGVSFELSNLDSPHLSFWLDEAKVLYASDNIVGEKVEKSQFDFLARSVDINYLKTIQAEYENAIHIIPSVGNWGSLEKVIDSSLIFIN